MTTPNASPWTGQPLSPGEQADVAAALAAHPTATLGTVAVHCPVCLSSYATPEEQRPAVAPSCTVCVGLATRARHASELATRVIESMGKEARRLALYSPQRTTQARITLIEAADAVRERLADEHMRAVLYRIMVTMSTPDTNAYFEAQAIAARGQQQEDPTL